MRDRVAFPSRCEASSITPPRAFAPCSRRSAWRIDAATRHQRSAERPTLPLERQLGTARERQTETILQGSCSGQYGDEAHAKYLQAISAFDDETSRKPGRRRPPRQRGDRSCRCAFTLTAHRGRSSTRVSFTTDSCQSDVHPPREDAWLSRRPVSTCAKAAACCPPPFPYC